MKNNPLHATILPYVIIEKGPLRIGIVGAGIHLKGLVTSQLYGEIVFLDTVKMVEDQARKLKNDERCDFIICLSHLGFSYTDNTLSDRVLAASTSSIDVIIGGHTHTFLEEPVTIANRLGNPVVINQVGWGGVQLGRLDFIFEKNRKARCRTCRPLWIEA